MKSTTECLTPLSWHLDPGAQPFGHATAAIIEAERQVPVKVQADTSLRPKILDACGMTCTFCHNEGVPVEKDNRGRANEFLAAGLSGRVSVFIQTNGVDFVPGKMLPDKKLRYALSTLRDALDLDEMHITGGEPTLHPDLPQIVKLADEEGYTVKMTSNGENGARIIPACAEAGLQKINFSIFGTTPKELAEVQHERYRHEGLAAAKIRALHRSIATAIENDVEVGANIVMMKPDHGERIRRVIDEFAPQLTVRILNDLGINQEIDSHYMVYDFLTKLGAMPVEASVTAGSSNARVKYQLPNGRQIYFKQIRPTRLPKACGDCSLNNDVDCKEGYYGIRLYVDSVGEYKVGVCLQRMDLTMSLDKFATSGLCSDVRSLRDLEMRELSDFYTKHNLGTKV